MSLGNVTSSSAPVQNTQAEQKKGMSTFKKVLLFAGGAISATALFALKHKTHIKQIKGLEEQLSQTTKFYQEKIEQYAKEISKSPKVVKTAVKKKPESFVSKAKKTSLATLSGKDMKPLLGFNKDKLDLALKELKDKGLDIVLNGYTPNQLILSHEMPLHGGFSGCVKGLKDGLADVTLFQKYDMELGTFKEILKVNRAT